MDENWCAFCLCILKDIDINESLALFNLKKHQHGTRKYSDELIDKIISLRKEKMTYKKIGQLVGVTEYVARNLCNYYSNW